MTTTSQTFAQRLRAMGEQLAHSILSDASADPELATDARAHLAGPATSDLDGTRLTRDEQRAFVILHRKLRGEPVSGTAHVAVLEQYGLICQECGRFTRASTAMPQMGIEAYQAYLAKQVVVPRGAAVAAVAEPVDDADDDEPEVADAQPPSTPTVTAKAPSTPDDDGWATFTRMMDPRMSQI